MPEINKKLNKTLELLAKSEYSDNVSISGLLDNDIENVVLQYKGGRYLLTFREKFNKQLDDAFYRELRPFTLKTSFGELCVEGVDAAASYSINVDDCHMQFEVELHAFKSLKINKLNTCYYRFIIPIEREDWLHDIATYTYRCENKIVKGLIDFHNQGQKHIHFYPVSVKEKKYLFIESQEKCTIKQMQDWMFAAVLSVGFFTGSLHMGEVFIVAFENGDFSDVIGLMYNRLRPSVKSIGSIFTTNMYSIHVRLEVNEKQHYAIDQLYKDGQFQPHLQDWLCEDTLCAMYSLLLDNEDVNRAVLTINEVMNLPLDYQGSICSVLLENIARALTKKRSKSKITKRNWKTIAGWMNKNLAKAVSESLMPGECYNYMKNRVDGMNYLPNRDMLMAPFIEKGYQLSQNEIDVIDLRNVFLHGDFPDGTPEEQREIIYYASCVFHRLCALLILKEIGFKGYITNNATLLGCKKALEAHEPALIYVS